ncbi:MAG: FmdB family zinc ribbon protein [Pyrinomonadaceae bacterium]
MPIYEYKCLDCSSHLEKMQKAADEPLTICENCGGRLEKQWSLSGFQFKGAGWYVTDYTDKTKEKTEEKSEKSEKAEKTEKTEKVSTSESTDKPETASNKTNDNGGSKIETVSKKE